jgi:hypothetical protein
MEIVLGLIVVWLVGLVVFASAVNDRCRAAEGLLHFSENLLLGHLQTEQEERIGADLSLQAKCDAICNTLDAEQKHCQRLERRIAALEDMASAVRYELTQRSDTSLPPEPD